MLEPEFLKLKEIGRVWFGKKGNSAPGTIRYLSEVEGLVPWTWWPHDEVGHTDEAKKEILAFTGDGVAFDTPKPERLMKRIVEIATNPGDVVLDCFAGSGTTGAVAHKMRRRYALVESADYCRSLIARRLRSVVDGADAKGVTEAVSWRGGGGFQFCELGGRLMDGDGKFGDSVRFRDLAGLVYFSEVGEPLPRRVSEESPLIGACRGVAYYLLFNGVLGDRTPHGGNVLTASILAVLPQHPDGLRLPRVVYGEGCRLSAERLRRENVIFKQIPYEIKGC